MALPMFEDRWLAMLTDIGGRLGSPCRWALFPPPADRLDSWNQAGAAANAGGHALARVA